LSATKNTGPNIKDRLTAALDQASGVLKAHEKKYK